MRINWSDCLLGLGTILLASVWLHMASEIRESLLSDAVGAGGVPKVLGWFMVGIGGLLCLRSLRSTPQAADAPQAATPKLRPHLMAAGLLAIMVCYIVLAPVLGYALAIALLVAAVGRFGGAPAGSNMLLIATGAGVGFWLIFVQLLGIRMPVSVFLGGL